MEHLRFTVEYSERRFQLFITRKFQYHSHARDIGEQELDDGCRLIAAEFENFYVVCVYVPTSGETLEKLPKRLR